MRLVNGISRADGRKYYYTPEGASLEEWAGLDTGDMVENARRKMVLKVFIEQNPMLDPAGIKAFAHIDCNWKCPVCGHEWVKRLDNVTDAKRWCGSPICNKRNTSLGEQLVYRIFKKNFEDVQFHYHLNKADGMEVHKGCFRYEYDIYIPSLNLLVEYNGENVHSNIETIYRDEDKRKTAAYHGCDLLVIVEKARNDKTDLECDIEFNGNSKDGFSKLAEMLKAYINDKYGVEMNMCLSAEERLDCYLGKFDGDRDKVKQAIIYLNDKFTKEFVRDKFEMSNTEVNRIYNVFRKLRLIRGGRKAA